ncbi:hypothetical protein BJ508DRAFT_323005 [Ascobolus immersus RN42]|uniref:Uncharacterized protein n=1 Tax=Ascobolus immersus RN42 TaxID=1160509 RepID=A0A3N4IKF6_ASCIM|nr:hypothetical protein BJ508DRAFT_323005 [Ascobolus immersus RN42]
MARLKRKLDIDPEESRKRRIKEGITNEIKERSSERTEYQIRLDDPAAGSIISFPFTSGPIPPQFDIDSGGNFAYYGRAFYEEFSGVIGSPRNRTQRRLRLDGTVGSGKSHILAAYTERSSGQTPICYIPDCNELLVSHSAADYILKALCLTFHSSHYEPHHEFWEEALELVSAPFTSKQDRESQLAKFCEYMDGARSWPDPSECILFIFDQAEALEHDTRWESPPLEEQKKKEVRDLLDQITQNHCRIDCYTGSPNYGKPHPVRSFWQRCLTLNGGLTKQEMESWWVEMQDTHGPLDYTNKDADYLERLTGRMPYLLKVLEKIIEKDVEYMDTPDPCPTPLTREDFGALKLNPLILRRKLLDSKEVQRLIHDIHDFGTKQTGALQDDKVKRIKFRDAWHACIFEMPTKKETLQYIDTRYFYIDSDGIGRSTCDFAREAGLAMLNHSFTQKELGYYNVAWVNRLRSFAANPSILELAVNKICIGNLMNEGTVFANRHFSEKDPEYRHVETRIFNDSTGIYPIVFDSVPEILTLAEVPYEEETVTQSRYIYIPTEPGYSMDCVLVYINPDSESGHTKPRYGTWCNCGQTSKCVVVGVQFSNFRGSTRESEQEFLKKWKHWEHALPCNSGFEFRFLQLLGESGNEEAEDSAWTRIDPTVCNGKMVHPEYYKRVVTYSELNKTIADQLAEIRKQWEAEDIEKEESEKQAEAEEEVEEEQAQTSQKEEHEGLTEKEADDDAASEVDSDITITNN